MSRHIENLTGDRPPSCPWRVMNDDLVRVCNKLMILAPDNLAASELGDDPPAVWLDAYAIFRTAYRATKAHDDKQEHERRMKERRAHTKRR